MTRRRIETEAPKSSDLEPELPLGDIVQPPAPRKGDIAVVSSKQAPLGLEGITVQDIIIPRLKVLQAISPELRRGHELFDDIMKPGDVIDSSYGTRFQKPLEVVCALQKKRWLEWWPRESGRGLCAVHDIMPPEYAELDARRKAGEHDPLTSAGTMLAQTHDFYVVLPASGVLAVISMASTHLRAARRWLFLAMSANTSIFSRSYGLSTAEMSNSKGTWYTWTIRPTGAASAEATKAAVDYRNMLINNTSGYTIDYNDALDSVAEGSEVM